MFTKWKRRKRIRQTKYNIIVAIVDMVWFYDFQNLDFEKKPICCRCKYAIYDNVRSKFACQFWIPKKPGELIIIPKKY